MNINIGDIAKNLQQAQTQMDAFKEKLGETVVTGIAGGGMVEIDLNGQREMLAVRVSPDAAEDLEVLQALIVAAYANAVEKIEEALKDKVGDMVNNVMRGGFPGQFS